MKTIFSGIQPTGNLHIGNYIGALSQWVKLQENNDCIFCVVDLHAITAPQNPVELKEKVKEITALYLAAGIDPKKAHIFVQSENSDHAELTWILNCIAPFGQLERMTQFKDKSLKYKEGTTVGLFDYPVLMAADILLYDTDEVPVGDDQKQHIELTRDLAEKFNRDFGDVFKLPVPLIQRETARIMSLQNPANKMSKSSVDPLGTINLLDSDEEIREKIKKAVTDSNSSISRDNGGEAISNLLIIYAAFQDISLDKAYDDLDGKSYGEFKNILADLVAGRLKEIREKYAEIKNDETYLRQVLDDGLDYARSKSSEKLLQVKKLVGFV
jgi:tryptophanyl-tRNA synthetase